MLGRDRMLALESMALILVPDDPSDTYFAPGGRDFFIGISLYLIKQDIHTTLPKIARAIVTHDSKYWCDKINESHYEEAMCYTSSYADQNEKNRAGAYNSIVKAIRPFANEDMEKLLSESDNMISPEALDHGEDIYIELPADRISVYAPLTTILTTSFETAFQNRPDLSTGIKPQPILFLLDEIGSMKFDFESLNTSLSTLRSKGISHLMACQSLQQLTRKYGETGTATIMDNCAYVGVMSAQDPKSAEYFSNLFGQKKTLKHGYTDKKRSVLNREDSDAPTNLQEAWEPVIRPSQFANLNDKIAILFRGKYIIADKTYFFKK